MSPTLPDSGAALPSNAGEEVASISDEQNFSAVSSRETIESDAERLATYQAEYTQVEAQAVLDRPRGSSVSIVQYALSTTNTVGQSLYRRSSLSGQARAERNCGRYTSADFAQIAFLEAGGPNRDRYGIDPDGDGFACNWDPTPFRAARGVANPIPADPNATIDAADLQAAGLPTGSAPSAPLPGDTLNISTE